MEPTGLSSLPTGDNSFLLIHYTDNESVVVPKWFVRKFPDVGQLQNVLLSDPMDNTFAIKVRSEASKLLFAEGFKDICQAHNIADIVRVHYRYTGTGHFNIRIFYDEVTEVNYQVLEDPADDDDEDFADHDDGYFAWLNVLTKPMVTDGQVLSIPARYVNTKLKHHPSSLNIILPDESVERWVLKWATERPWQCVFGVGWYDFATNQRLRARDQLVFYKMPQADTYKVVIIRH